MKRTILSLLAATTLAAGVPAIALAQDNMSINERQSSLDARIDAGVRNRSLTDVEAAQLRSEFQGIARLEAQYRSSGRGLTAAERADLDNRFDLLSRRIRYDRNDRDGRSPQQNDGQNINQRQRTLDDRIDAGIRDGSLTRIEAAQLRRDFDVIARQEAQYRSSGRGLTQAERSDLDRRFDALSSRIRSDRHDNDTRADGQAINQRQAQLSARIDAGVRDRSLTSTEAAQLRAEFDAIARQEAQARNSGRGLTQAERADLDRRFDMLERRVKNDRHDDDRRWTNLDQRQAQFNERLNRAVSDGRVSRQESISLRSEFDAIARLERQYQRSRPGITVAERADLNSRFNRMEANYRTSVNNGRYGSGQYDNLFDFLIGLTG